MLKNLFLISGLVISMSAQAQIDGLIKDLKSITEKAKKQTQQVPQAPQTQPAPQTQQTQQVPQAPQAQPAPQTQQTQQNAIDNAAKIKSDQTERNNKADKLIANGYKAMLEKVGAPTVSACEKIFFKVTMESEQNVRNSAEKAATKKEQKEKLETADILKGMVPVSGRAGCLMRYYVAVEHFNFGTSMVENEDKVMIALTEDNLTDNSLKSLRESMTFSNDKFFETYIYSEKNSAEAERKLGVQKGSFAAAANIKLKRMERLVGIFASAPQALGCSEISSTPLLLECR